MKAQLLFAVALLLGSAAAVWEINYYYPYNYYYDYTNYEYVYTCDTLEWVEIEELGEGYTCTPYDCNSYYPYNYERYCAETEDDFPDFALLFPLGYYGYTGWEDQEFCFGDPTYYAAFGDDDCYYSDYYESAHRFECHVETGEILQYTRSYTDSLCSTGSEGSPSEMGIAYYVDQVVADCYGYSGDSWMIDCTPGTTNAAWQVVAFSGQFIDSDVTDCSAETFGYHYYWTEDCQELTCVAGREFMETWTCVDIEPLPELWFTNPVFVNLQGGMDYTCSGDTLDTYVWDLDGCWEDNGYFYSVSADFDGGEVQLQYNSGTTCGDSYLYSYSDDVLPFYGYEQFGYGCWEDESNYRSFFTLSTISPVEMVQTIVYYIGNSSGAIGRVDQFTTNDCVVQTVDPDYYSPFFEDWLCEIAGLETDPFSLLPDGLLMSFYDITDDACVTDPVAYMLFSQDCLADPTSTYHYKFYCSSSTTDGSMILYECGTDDVCDDANCYQDSTIYDSYYTPVVDYCYPESVYGYTYDYYYWSLHCGPPNPAYQVIEYYAAPNATDAGQIVYVEYYFNQYCMEQEVQSTDFYEKYWCSLLELSPLDYWDNPIHVLFFDDDTCATSSDEWTAFNPTCVNDLSDGTSWATECDDIDGDIVLRQYGSDINSCRDNEVDWFYEFDSWYSYYDGCFEDYDNSGYFYYNLYCGADNAAWQVIEYSVSLNYDDNYLAMYEYYYDDHCNPRGELGWNYYTDEVSEYWGCMPTEPSAYTIWPDAKVVYFYGDDDTCAAFDHALSYNPDCLANDLGTHSFMVQCDVSSADAQLYLYEWDDTNVCAGDYWTSDEVVSSSYLGAVEYCFEESSAYFELNCYPPNPAWQIVEYYANTDSLDATKEVMVSVYWDDFCYVAEGQGTDFYEVYSCNATLDNITPDTFITDAYVINYYSDDCITPDGWIAAQRYCVDDADGTSWYFDCSSDETSADLELYHCDSDQSLCRGDCYYVMDIEDGYSYGDNGCMDEGDNTFTLECWPWNPKWQVAEAYYAVDDSDDTTLAVVMVVFSEYCMDYGLYTMDFYSQETVYNYWCADVKPDVYGYWADGYVIDYYPEGDTYCATPVTNATYILHPGCLDSYDGTWSESYECSFSQEDGAELVYDYYYSPTCTGTPYTTDIIYDYWDGDRPYCYEDYYGDYFVLSCRAPNPAWQIISTYSSPSATEPAEATSYYDLYCQEYTPDFDVVQYDYSCSTDDLDLTTLFTSVPITVNWYAADDCSGDAVMHAALTVDCVSDSVTEESFWAYCMSNDGIAVGYMCPWAAGYEECTDNADFINDCYEETIALAMYTDYGAGCWQDYVAYYYMDEVLYFDIDCGDMTTNSVYWDSIVTGVGTGSCETSAPVYAEGTFTRFCGATETCVQYDSVEDVWINDTCIAQVDVAAVFTGGVYGFIYTDPDCDPDYQVGFAAIKGGGCTGVTEDNIYWQVNCDKELGTVTISYDCDSTCGICDTTDEVITVGECFDEGGIYVAWTCGASSTVAGLFVVALAALLTFFL